jgi:DNA-binding IclR family transcriptional regulator
MPRKAVRPNAPPGVEVAEGGAAAVDRALMLLGAFRLGDEALNLAELAERTALYKSTVLRLLASLQHARLIQRLADGRYRLGPEVARLYAVYVASFSLEGVVVPVLRALVASTQESAAYHVRQGDARLCLYRVDSPHPVRDHIRVGELLPLDRGAGGRVLMAYAGARGEGYDQIRRDQVAVLAGDRVPELAGISAPVFGPDGQIAGAVTLTMPVERLQTSHREHVMRAAREITSLVGGTYPPPAP